MCLQKQRMCWLEVIWNLWQECNMLHRDEYSLGEKYTDLPGVRKYHDFLVVKAHDGTVVMKVREKCFDGIWKESPLVIYLYLEYRRRTHKESHCWKDGKHGHYVWPLHTSWLSARLFTISEYSRSLHLHSFHNFSHNHFSCSTPISKEKALPRRGVMVLDTRILPNGL